MSTMLLKVKVKQGLMLPHLDHDAALQKYNQ